MSHRHAHQDPSRSHPAVDQPGLTRIDLAGSSQAEEAARDATRRWCTDRAVPTRAAARIVLLTQAATRHGLQLGPRAVALGLRWLDADRVAVDVCSHDCARLRDRAGHAGADAAPTAAFFDAATEDWGLRVQAHDEVRWFVVDTSR